MKRISLTRGFFAIVDDADFKMLSKMKWCSSVRSDGKAHYARNQTTYMHRFIMNAPSHLCVDHKNGNSLDNRRSNLRLATHQQNMANSAHRIGPSGYRGVCWSKKSSMWHSEITIGLGYFKSAKEASEAYSKAEKLYRGKFSFSSRRTA